MWKSISILSYFLIVSIHSAPPSRNSTNGDVAPCLSAFYSVAFNGEYNCTSDFDFLSLNASSQHESFKTGKSCFLQVAKSECTSAQYTLLSTKYDDFLDVLTNEPTDIQDCSSFYFKYNSLKCEPLMQSFMKTVAPIITISTKANDSRVLEGIELCHQIQECISPVCFTSSTEREMITDSCKSIGMKNSDFSICLTKIQKTTPDMSGYTCLGDMDFYDPGVPVAMEKLTTKKSCLKEIMKDICGEKSIQNFDENTEFMLKTIKRMIAMTGVFTDNA
uniref:DUF19 domain-containing protein n=1 Tax=Caenorhabditis tropicalis TaxID=1561998 RepID=A0A1I7TYL0_9PELO